MKKYFIYLLIPFFLTACQKNVEIDFNKIELTDLNGNLVKLSDLKGKTVFVNFWATWCKPCIKEMPRIEITKKILEREGYEFVFVSEESLEKLNKFKASKNFKFNYLKSNKKFEELGVNTLPTTVILNKDLKKIASIKGEQRWESAGHLKLLRQYANAK